MAEPTIDYRALHEAIAGMTEVISAQKAALTAVGFDDVHAQTIVAATHMNHAAAAWREVLVMAGVPVPSEDDQ